MSYKGTSVPIPLGELGLQTDAPMTSLSPSALIKANNVSLYSGKIEKAKGALRYSNVSLGAEIVSVIDWWPTGIDQRMIALTANGMVWRDTGDRLWGGVSPVSLPSVEVQKFTLSYPPVSGTLKINFAATDTAAIPYNASAAAIQTAVRTLPGLPAAVVSGNFQTGFRVLMRGTVGDQPMMTTNTNTLIGRNSQIFTFSAAPTAGTWTISYNNGGTTFTTAPLPYNTVASVVQSSLRAADEDLQSVTVTGDFASGFTVQMVGFLTPPLLTAQTQGLLATATPVVITVTANGSVSVTVTEESKGKTSLGSITTDAHMTQGGQEESGKNKKLFIFTGTSQIQIIDGDVDVTRDISNPSPDWATGNYPTYGIIYQGRLCVFGCPTNPHQVYYSTTTDHENFIGDKNEFPPALYVNVPPTFSIFPGEADGLITAAVYRGLLFLFKEPFGVYIMDGQDPDPINWQIRKYADSFGVQSPHGVLQVLTDVIASNSSGSYTSLQATDAYGGFEAGDVLANNLIEEYIRSLFNPVGIPKASCIYYPEKKVAYFTGQTSIEDTRDQMLVMDVARRAPRFTLDTKERPNCLALRRDTQRIQRPMYGDKSGFVWLMDQETYNRGTLPYLGEFQTAYTDVGVGNQNKLFDFLEVNYVATGNNSFFVDVFVDGEIRQTLTFNQVYGEILDEFVLDEDQLAGDANASRNRKPLRSCMGNRISFRFYNNSFNEGFKIERVIVSFRPSDERVQKGQV